MAEYPLDICGQQPFLLLIYTQITLCFDLPDDSPSSTDQVILTLKRGLERLSESFPWVTGQISKDDVGNGKIAPFESIPPLIVRDLRDDRSIPSMATLKASEFPMRMLDESVIAPRKTIPDDFSSTEPTPVFLLQATFITGGLLLTVLGQHGAMDMTGQAQLIHLLHKACKGEPFTCEEIASGNLQRDTLVPLLDKDYKPGPELDNQLVKIAPPGDASPDLAPASRPPKCVWAYFSFSADCLREIKSIASQALPADATFISTDDALTAFIWQAITRIRFARFEKASISTSTLETQLARAVDVRRFLGVPDTYTGLCQNMTYHQFPFSQIVSAPLGVIAADLRRAVDPKSWKRDLNHATRALATLMQRTPPASRGNISLTANMSLAHSIMLSSWSKPPLYSLDFGLGLGKPVSVRRPQFTPCESLLYLMPKREDGEVSLAVCLKEEEMEQLRTDEEFGKYARYIG
ncbi:trichothecene 3-O-acetyltransferase [Coprinopsis cinerea okayama7|uniref:Trichothecene 3-O-acetyltransferase n=1 Tax=Coprinopsis cinerea (strain Okayama-7 / 130 / ATCC MYA-4618 / FGSC 9003) TaxID=240176 RepID=A8NSP5_COPC7|nr:trichothecene 3-O-acetyltransferase [Coprinopsis cinerea okayama7\|eukprot:XP_001836059.1 trichothecene 3-O-acetyltransferase [Coprinopsis cinerea okayama7\